MIRKVINGVRKKSGFTAENQRGFTLLELLIGTVAAAILSYAALSLYVTQHEQLIVQDEIADLQGNLRASAEVLATAIRQAGYNSPKHSALLGANSDPDTITITFDSGTLEYVKLSESMPAFTSELICAGCDLSGISQDEWYYIYDRESDNGEFFVVTAIAYGDHLLHDIAPLSRLYPAGSSILKMTRMRFFIDQPDSTHSNLMMQVFGAEPQVFAENVIDLDFRYYLDNGPIVNEPSNPDRIRLVEINVMGRTASRDHETGQYRTRNFSLRVNVRNLGLHL